MAVRLLTVNPEAIVAFCREHPVDMMDAWRRETNRGGRGDVQSPTPAVETFFQLYLVEKRGVLPTQAEYVAYCRELWSGWYGSLPLLVQQSFDARLYRNFYPSFLDSVHVWALLGTRFYANHRLVFDLCLIDTDADAREKADLLAYRGEECLRIGHHADSWEAYQAAQWKQTRRPGPPIRDGERRVELVLPLTRARQYGKRWYQWPEDFRPVMRKVEQLWLPGLG